jgi:isoleucyl-tRNA synthetase
VEAYRKIRNTFRYLLSNLYDFDPTRDLVPIEALQNVDRFAVARCARVARKVLDAYEAYEFQTIFHALNEFITVDLSAFYADVSKDRLYTLRADSPERRSAQSAQYLVADGLARLMAPILSITADEIWRYLPGPREASVHLADFPAGTDAWTDAALEADWAALLDVRAAVNAALETARVEKTIGAPLTAHVAITAPRSVHDLLIRYATDLPMLFIVSGVAVEEAPAADAPVRVRVSKADGEKCPRCWRFVTDMVLDGDLAGLCLRCADALGDHGVGA